MKWSNKFAVVILAMVFILGQVGTAKAATTTVSLATADGYAILAGTGITNIGATTIAGDVGSSATPTETGFGSVTFSSGANHTAADPNDATTVGAKVDLTAAYTDAAGRTPTTTYSPIHDLGGATLTSGVYNDPSSFAVTGTLTLDAQGDTAAVWIFQAGSTLITASSSKIALINGAQSCNVFWQVGSSATLGTSTTFVGNILALTSITLDTGATVDGRVLARNGAVTLDNNTITASTCAATSTAATAAAEAVTAAAKTKLPGTGIFASQNTLLWSAILLNWIFTLSIIIYLARGKRQD